MTAQLAETAAASRGDRILWAIAGLGLLLRLFALGLLPNIEFPDTISYVENGQHLFQHGLLRDEIYMPLYPIWTYLWGGDLWLKLADIALSVATIWLVHEFTRAAFSDLRAARIAAIAAAIYPHFIFYSVARLTETGHIFLLLLAFLLLLRDRVLLAALCLVLSILIRPTLDLLAPVLVLAFALVTHRKAPAEGFRRLGIYALCYVALMTPWWLHNHAKYGEFVRLNLGDGLVLYSGNNPHNQSGGGVSYNPAERDLDRDPFDAIADPLERNRAYKDAAWSFIRDNPGRALELAAIKFTRFWRLWPYTSEYRSVMVVTASLASYGSMLVLALLFLAMEGWRWRHVVAPILLLMAYLTIVHMVTIGSIRYRLPLEPFLIVFACRAIAELSRRSTAVNTALARTGL